MNFPCVFPAIVITLEPQQPSLCQQKFSKKFQVSVKPGYNILSLKQGIIKTIKISRKDHRSPGFKESVLRGRPSTLRKTGGARRGVNFLLGEGHGAGVCFQLPRFENPRRTRAVTVWARRRDKKFVRTRRRFLSSNFPMLVFCASSEDQNGTEIFFFFLFEAGALFSTVTIRPVSKACFVLKARKLRAMIVRLGRARPRWPQHGERWE